ncbi:MAG TPA: proteasome ATPase [Actinomycetota bacterium]|nr:proteasome ATPase [Actinomycetota bacterium]
MVTLSGGATENGRFDDVERELTELRDQLRRAAENPFRRGETRSIRLLEERLREMQGRLVQSLQQNERLVGMLQETRQQVALLREEVEKLTAPPSGFGVFLGLNSDGTVNVFTGGRKLRVNVHPQIDPKLIVPGQELMLNEALNVVEACGFETAGEVVTVKEVLDTDRVSVISHADEERIALLGDPLRETNLRAGDHLLFDAKSGYVLERLPKPEVDELVLEEVPDITYEDVGGLREQIIAIQDAVELPYMHPELFAEHKLRAPKGVLLYGPPGCGKTLIAKAVANALAKKVAEKTGRADARSYFLNVKGPELLNKYVGETERQIRLIFQRAKEKSTEGVPVIVFFDEMDSLFRTRGTGISSDMEATIVPQLLAEIDGVESLKNVIVIGASNREDLIDPAILRPGRLDVKIKIDRPDIEAARAIFAVYVTPDLPFDQAILDQAGGDTEKACQTLIERVVDKMYAATEENRFLEVTYASGDKEVLYFKDFSSGAMIESIVGRAKKQAIKRLIADNIRGIQSDDLLVAIRDEYKENEDLPNTTNPDDWARISGKKGERIVYVRTLLGEGREHRPVETITPGQYL